MPAGFGTIEDVLAAHRGGALVWSGAVHVVDVTDRAGRVTRRTAPEHRKYHVHFLCRASAAAALPVVSPEHSLGTDWGVAVALVCSDGTAHRRYASPDQQQANRERHTETRRLQQSMAAKTVGSRRHAKQNRRRQRLLAKSTDVRVNRQCHTAKAVVATPGVRHVVLEDTKASHLTASAEGTKAFPVKGSAGKRGFDRSLAETAPARQTDAHRAGRCRRFGVHRAGQPRPQSMTCFVCGGLGERETQAVFRCPQCGTHAQADVQASLNTNETGTPGCTQPGTPPTAAGTAVTRRWNTPSGSSWTPSTSTETSQTNMPEQPPVDTQAHKRVRQ